MDPESNTPLSMEAWVDRYGDALFHFTLARVKKREIAEDLVQETFLAAVRSRDRFKGLASEKTWLFGILKHKVLDYFRKSKTQGAIDTRIDHPEALERCFNVKGGWQDRPAHWSVNPGKSHATGEFLDHFYRCLAALPERTADAFVYREIDGRSTDEICKALDISASNCWTMLYCARMGLRKCLEGYGYHPRGEGQST